MCSCSKRSCTAGQGAHAQLLHVAEHAYGRTQAPSRARQSLLLCADSCLWVTIAASVCQSVLPCCLAPHTIAHTQIVQIATDKWLKQATAQNICTQPSATGERAQHHSTACFMPGAKVCMRCPLRLCPQAGVLAVDDPPALAALCSVGSSNSNNTGGAGAPLDPNFGKRMLCNAKPAAKAAAKSNAFWCVCALRCYVWGRGSPGGLSNCRGRLLCAQACCLTWTPLRLDGRGAGTALKAGVCLR